MNETVQSRLVNVLPNKYDDTVEYIFNFYGNDNKYEVCQQIYDFLIKKHLIVKVWFDSNFGGNYEAICKGSY